MAKVRLQFLQKPTCTTCRKAKTFLQKCGAELEARDLDKERLSEADLDALIGRRDHRSFLNSRNKLYRTQKMKDHPPSRAEALKLMAKEPNLIRRPVVIRGERMVLGYDEKALQKLTK